MPVDLNPGPRKGWRGGMNNRRDIHRLGDDFVRRALNIDFDSEGKPHLRPGFSVFNTGYAHSLYSAQDWDFAMCVQDGQLYILREADGTIFPTAVGVIDPLKPVTYARMNDHIYLSNALITAKVNINTGVPSAWGIEDPNGQPLLVAQSTGGMDAGRYKVVMTYVAQDGEESGSEEAVFVDVVAGGGIMLQNIPQPINTSLSIRIYLSAPNGEVVYHAETIPYGVTTYMVNRQHDPGKPLETYLCQKVPPCSIVRAHGARLYFAIDDFVYYTEPYRFGLYKRHATYYRMPDKVVMIEPVEDGVYVGTKSRVVFIVGKEPKDSQMLTMDLAGVVPGTGMCVSGHALIPDSPKEPVAVWWSNPKGLMLGYKGGQVAPMTDKNLALPKYLAGATMFREYNGMRHLLTVLSEPDDRIAVGASDKVVTEVIRNGVVIA